MGMFHDFHEKNGGHDGPCNGQGLMSYGNVPQQWSTCSRADYLVGITRVAIIRASIGFHLYLSGFNRVRVLLLTYQSSSNLKLRVFGF